MSRGKEKPLLGIICWAINCWDTTTNRVARNNSDLSVSPGGVVITIKAKAYIPAGMEILWPYGSAYVYPSLPDEEEPGG